MMTVATGRLRSMLDRLILGAIKGPYLEKSMPKPVRTDWWTGRQEISIASLLKNPKVQKNISKVKVVRTKSSSSIGQKATSASAQR